MLSEKSKNKLIAFQPLDSVLHYGKVKLAMKYPFKTIYYYFFKKFFYDRTQKGKIRKTATFFDDSMNIMLPAGIDIFFFGLKSHPSEIALSRYMMNTLNPGDSYLDIGAHFGYYTLLASKIVGPKGKVIAIEASPETYKITKSNTEHVSNIEAKNMAISETDGGTISFYVFPVYYSELNTLNPDQYKQSSWYGKIQPQKVEVPTTTVSHLLAEHNINPKIIKIDVEGAEDRVLGGAVEKLRAISGTAVIIEYINDGKDQSPYIKSENLMRSIGYVAHSIKIDGTLNPCGPSVKEFMDINKLTSENIVFLKK